MPAFDTPEPIAVTLDVTAGHVRIHAGDRTDTVVEVRPADASRDADVQAAGSTKVDYANGQLTVKAPRNTLRTLFGRPGAIEVTIDLPSDSRLQATGWADYQSQGRIGESVFDGALGSVRLDQTGRLKLRTAAGNVSVARSTGPVDISTSSGKVWVGEIDGAAVVKSSNGDITVGDVTGDVQLKTANGDITVYRALAAVSAKTANGSVRVGEVVRGSVVLETGFGDVELGVREGTAAWLDVSSQYGTVRSDLEASEKPGESDDTVEVHGRTSYGDILIRRP
ncbi:DUF4097 family beta strand repeat-containing protein [Actinomadura sp. DC4]|uniref:DUF4097 family beta strand repeat-containing protein n=1 Tax=Actinomadura sp. DC4 TaxID=3055069 RepID=UPI0025B188D2|nr:DUF4097 family beta strand repeat-containing protein [Actinomadura sp. DC4]MDN3351811.1 DUF4097 family beta strand repeat-containing protein [Actinomadura sp. DC4]